MANTSVATISWRDIGLMEGCNRYRQKLDEDRFYKKLNNFQQEK